MGALTSAGVPEEQAGYYAEGVRRGSTLVTVEASEEAVVNAMVAAETMTGKGGTRVYAIPHDRLREALRKYNRLAP